jgi:hypothetical protein
MMNLAVKLAIAFEMRESFIKKRPEGVKRMDFYQFERSFHNEP